MLGSARFGVGESAAGEQEERPNIMGAEAPPSKDAAEYVKASNFTGTRYHGYDDQGLSFEFCSYAGGFGVFG